MTTNAKNLVSELLPCPFCGGKAGVSENDQADAYTWVAHVICEQCDAAVSDAYGAHSETEALEQVIALWNTRAPMLAQAGDAVSVEELSQPTRNGEVVMDPSVLDWEYMYGWNACRKAMLSAAPKREGE